MVGKNTVMCNDEINRFLIDYPYERNNGGAIFIHTSIFEKFRERIIACDGDITDKNGWYYDFTIGSVEYNMCLVWINLELMIQSNLHMIVSESKYSFPWEPYLTLYTTIEKFNLIEEFIQQHTLEKFVRNIYTDATRICIQHKIKVVEFTSEITRTLLPVFRTFLDQNNYQPPNSYFATRAFKYLRPSYLSYYEKPYENDYTITQVLLLLDYHREQSKRGNEIFNIFDLIALKMAIDDNRVHYENCEFHKLLNKKLTEITNKGLLHLNKYHGELGTLGYSEEVYQYLISQYSAHFKKIKVFDKFGTFKIKPERFVSLSKVDNLLSTSHFYNKLNVHVDTLNEHNSNVLWKILTYSYLNFRPTMSFHTDKELEVKLTTPIIHDILNLPSRDIHFKDNNPNHFIENLINWMRLTMGSRWDDFDLRFIGSEIKSPCILRGLTVRMIIMKNVKITCKFLRALRHVNYKRIKFSKCYLENDPDIFMLIDALEGDRCIQINITRQTIDILMKSIERVLLTTGCREFRFKNYVTIYYLESKFEYIELCRFKFYINDEGNKIETFDLYTNETVNIFDYFYKGEQITPRNEYNFYE